MSAQTIYTQDAYSLHDSVDKAFITWGKDYSLSTKFGIGSIGNTMEMKLLADLDRILCEDNCVNRDLAQKVTNQIATMVASVNKSCIAC